MSQTAIQFSGLRKSYGGTEVLHGIDLEIDQGEIFGFLGPNGAGKTTTIRCLLDLIHPNGGKITIMGLDPQLDPVKVRSLTGYLPGELHLEDNLKAKGVFEYFAQLRGNHLDWNFVQELCQRLDLDLSLPVKSMSKGNKQKVGVVQALMSKPSVLLLDEPTSGLDPLIQQEVLKLVKEAAKAGATVFFSSHVLSEVQEIAARLAIIRDGRIVEVAKTEDLLHRSLRIVEVRFRDTVPVAELKALGVRHLHVRDHLASFQVEGSLQALMQLLGKYAVVDLESVHPSLEEVFLSYYGGGDHDHHR